MSEDAVHAREAELSSASLISTPFVVGIGASAGGLEALERFFDNVPRDSGAAFVLVQHLSPDFRSLMDELLARHTNLPIHLVEDGMRVLPNHVYLIPPKKEMIISAGRLLLSERDRQHELSLPIDVFFRSLAQDCGAHAVAVVLSGGGSDGSRGARTVHEAGGLVIVQDTESAQFDGMPRTTRDAGIANWVLPPQEMPRVIVEHVRTSGAFSVRRPTDGSGHGLAAVYRMLQNEFGIDFTHYKPSTITRRIERRLRLARADDLDEYVERLQSERAELDVLYRDLLIGVTRFFRNEEAFDALGHHVLPELLRTGEPLRVWVAGCATGEEVYSLAILLDEATTRAGAPSAKFFATDVHRGSLEVASHAVYDEAALAHVSKERRDKYFRQRGLGYEVVPDIRQNVVFAPHNVIKDPPFTRVDLVSCRNLLIYLQPAAQEKALSLFHFALVRGGALLLGPSESPGALADDFTAVDRRWRLYRKHGSARVEVDARLRPSLRPHDGAAERASTSQVAKARLSMVQLLASYDALLEKFMPPSLLVSDAGDLLQSFGGASRFLKVRDGRHGTDVLGMVEPELRLALGSGLRRATSETSSLVFKGVRAAPGDDAPHTVTIERFRAGSSATNLLVSFEPAASTLERTDDVALHRQLDFDEIAREQIGALQNELTTTKENLQAAIEELQTSNEELQAANEELLASNEELQSTNEELQSVNEELYTVNAEYQRKIAELTELTNDMDNLLASTDVGTIFLDRQLRIRKFTLPIGATFNLMPQDVGRSIETFRHDLDLPELANDLRRVLTTGEQVEREIRDRASRSYFLRLLPYRAKGEIDGVVLTMIDISGLKAAEDALFHERYLLNSLLSSVPDAIYFKDARGKLIRANQAMAVRLGLSDPAEMVGKTALELPDQSVALALHREDDAVFKSGEAQHYRLERFERPGNREEWDLVTRLPLRDPEGATVGIIGIFRDVTRQKQAEERSLEAVRLRDQFLAMLSHELRNPLGAIVTATALLKQSENDRSARILAILERQSQQMARLLDDLLEASRVTENKIELRKQIVDMRDVTREAADAARSLMEGRGLSFDVEIESTPLLVDGDPARLQQIEANLLNNAAKYTPQGGHIVLVARREDEGVAIRVRDDGAGIAEEMLETVFDLFVQAGRTLDRAQGGIGVGLTLVRALVRMHGGSVVAKSEGHGKGTEVVVHLPATVATPLTDDASSSDAGAGLSLRRGARVAVVEDNPDSREMLCEALVRAGFECVWADNGAAGLVLIETTYPDVALVDVGLPSIDGLELARRVRASEKHSKTRLIALTGYGQREDRAQALASGFDMHLVKPVDPNRLVRLLGSES